MPETRRHHFDRNGRQQKAGQTADNLKGSRSQDLSAFGNKPETQPGGNAYHKRRKQHSQPVTDLRYLGSCHHVGKRGRPPPAKGCRAARWTALKPLPATRRACI